MKLHKILPIAVCLVGGARRQKFAFEEITKQTSSFAPGNALRPGAQITTVLIIGRNVARGKEPQEGSSFKTPPRGRFVGGGGGFNVF